MKKILMMVLSLVLVAALSIGGTVAYLQDDDSDVNVMTLGSVYIEQIEQERDANGNLVDFTQAKPLYPYVGEIAWNDAKININGHDYNMFGEKLKNAVDKIVTVKNTGKSDAYVRTWIALEDPFDTSMIGVNVGGVGYTQSSWTTATIDGVQYSVSCFTYDAVLKPGEVSLPSFLQVYLKYTATNEDVEKLGNTYDILAFSQAVQAEGFADAATALNAAFGANHPWAGEDVPVIPTVVSTAAELAEALTEGKSVILANDIVFDTAITVAEYANIDLNGNTLSTVGLDLQSGGTIEDGTITSAGNTYLTPHLKVSGGALTMDNVSVDVDDHLNANVYWSEATGMEVANATAVLNNCDIKIHNGTGAQWVYSYGISLNNAEITVNGGSVTATCVAGTAANGPTNPNAICTMGACTATLNNVNVSATYYATTVNGHLTINTTDKNITSANIVDNRGGSHTLNYID